MAETTVAARPSLTRKQRLVLDFIRDHVRDNGFAPSVREIGTAVGMTSTSTIHHHLFHLQLKGYIARPKHGSTRLQVMHPDGAASACPAPDCACPCHEGGGAR